MSCVFVITFAPSFLCTFLPPSLVCIISSNAYLAVIFFSKKLSNCNLEGIEAYWSEGEFAVQKSISSYLFLVPVRLLNYSNILNNIFEMYDDFVFKREY